MIVEDLLDILLELDPELDVCFSHPNDEDIVVFAEDVTEFSDKIVIS